MKMYVFCEVGKEFLNLFTRILGFKRLVPLLLMSSQQYTCPATNIKTTAGHKTAAKQVWKICLYKNSSCCLLGYDTA